jgi:F0F1-type ATP synthase delta subunit
MSHTLSRRQLAGYAATELINGASIKEISAQLAAVLKESKRTNEAELLSRDIAYELETRGKVASTHVTSANALSESLRDDLLKFIKQAANVDEVNIEENVDKSVLGGIKIETAVHSWDKTVATKLRKIREAF